jgi:DNA-directed RNA polymerase subunit M/transcription elongation factor TFIIS
MRFCDTCGSRMELTKKGYFCQKCNTTIPLEIVEEIKTNHTDSEPIYIVDHSLRQSRRVIRSCSHCGNNEAFYWTSQISGEHAGVRQERTVEHFQCTKCLYMWAESQ